MNRIFKFLDDMVKVYLYIVNLVIAAFVSEMIAPEISRILKEEKLKKEKEKILRKIINEEIDKRG